MTEIEERLAALETEHEILSERFDMLTSFMMNALGLIAEDEPREALRGGIRELIVSARQSSSYDTLNDAQNLLRAFERVMPPPTMEG